MNDLSYVKSKNSLRQREKKDKIKRSIRAKVGTTIANCQQLRASGTIDQELIALICCCVEELIKKKYGIDKKQFVMEIVSDLFPHLTAEEEDNVQRSIQYIYDNGLISTVPMAHKVMPLVMGWLRRRIL